MRSPESSNLAIFFDHIEPCQGLIQCSVQTQSKTKTASSDVLEDRPEHSIEALNLKTKIICWCVRRRAVWVTPIQEPAGV